MSTMASIKEKNEKLAAEIYEERLNTRMYPEKYMVSIPEKNPEFEKELEKHAKWAAPLIVVALWLTIGGIWVVRNYIL